MFQKAKNFITNHKKLLLIIIAILLAVFIWYKLSHKTAAPPFQTAVAQKGALISSVSASGQVLNANNTNVITTVTGQIKNVYVKNGDTVKKGQKLFSINLDTVSSQKQAQALSSLLQAKNSVEGAITNLYTLQAASFAANQKFINDAVARNLPTNDPTYIQEYATWKAAEANYTNQQNSINQAKASLTSSSLSYQLTSSTITAPVSGTIDNIILATGFPLSDTSTTLATIQTPGNPIASVNIAEVDVTKIKSGQKVTLTFDSIPDYSFTGKVIGINKNGLITSGVTSYPATISFDSSSQQILPNMAVNASIITNIKDDVILIPSTAVQTTNGTTTVRILKDNQPTSVDVEIGDKGDNQTEIISGIIVGDTVITSLILPTTNTTNSTQTSPFGAQQFRGGFGGGGRNVNFITR